MSRRLRIQWAPGRKVTGRLEISSAPQATGVLLAPGAGAGQNSEFMVGLRGGLARAGYPTLSFDYPYQEGGRRSPDRPPTLEACHAAAADRLRAYVDHIVFAGKSMGGRIGSHVVAAGAPAAGLVFYGYPLVPVGKSEPRDTSHLDGLGLPMLFCAGSRDRLGPLDLVTAVSGRLDRAQLYVVSEGDHSFKVPQRTGFTYDQVLDDLVATTVTWMQSNNL